MAIALVAAAIVLLQITLTRLLSVVLWYHWAFFSISLAMLGVGAPGVWLALRPPRRTRRWLAGALAAAAILAPLGVVAIVRDTFGYGIFGIVFSLIALLPAVLALGTATCLLLMEARGAAVGRRYGFDLIGACCGALAVVPLMNLVPTPQLAAGTGVLALAAWLVVARARRVPALLAIASVAVLADGRAFRLQHTKSYRDTAIMTPLFERWTPTARIAVFDKFMPHGELAFRWGIGRPDREGRAHPRQYWLELDGSAGSPITEFHGDFGELDWLFDDVTSIGYRLRAPQRVAIIGPGGGRDILTARLAGAAHIDAIELNAGIIVAMRDTFGAFSGGVYELPGVDAIVGEGRSVLTRSAGGYDVIQISMIDSWAATAAGAFTLTENNLYTLEAYRLYWRKLSERGIVATSRWMPSAGFGFEVFRLVSLVGAALAAEGIVDPARHVVLVQGGLIGTVLMSKPPFAPEDLAALARACDQRGFALHLAEHDAQLADLVAGRVGVLPDTSVSVAPPTDDAPFFFQPFSPFTAPDIEAARRYGVNGTSVITLRVLMLGMAVLAALLFFAPFLLTRWLARGAGFWRGSAFFLCIGLSFMCVEIAWLQRFVLYLGHPSLATTAALGCVLLGAGLGAMTSARVGLARAQRLGWCTAVLVVGANTLLAPLFAATIGWPLAARMLVTAAVLLPPAFTMGCFFPLGMVRFGDAAKAWMWAINGAAGVLASVVSLALSMELGFSCLALLGAGLYAAAWLLGRGERAYCSSPSFPSFGAITTRQ